METKQYHRLFELIIFKSANHKLKLEGELEKILDPVRNKWLVLTPEEVVRQGVIRFLQESCGYPFSIVNCEGGFTVGERNKHPDAVYYKEGEPVLLVECKSPFVEIDQSVVDQASRYNLHFNVPYILLTNGMTAVVLKQSATNEGYEILEQLPDYSEINTNL